MFRFIGLCLGTLVRLLSARRSLLLENLALRQQLAVLKRQHPRPRLDLVDKLFWVAVRRFWSGMATIPHCGHARNGGALAQGRIPYIYTNTARAFLRGRFLAIEGEGRTCRGQLSRQGIALFSVRIEFWRTTGADLASLTAGRLNF